MLSKIDYNMVIKIQKRYRILEKQVRDIEKNVQNINNEFREIDQYISDNLQNAFLENIYGKAESNQAEDKDKDKDKDKDSKMMSKLSVDTPFTTYGNNNNLFNKPIDDLSKDDFLSDGLNEITDKPSDDSSADDSSAGDFLSDDLSVDDLSVDDLSVDDLSVDDSSYTKTYSAQLQYPIQDLAMNVVDYIDSNPDLTEITFLYCCFSINKDNIVPFVLYSVDSNNGTVRFPSMKANATDDISKYVNDIIKGGTFVGYIPDKPVVYLFYSFPDPESLPGKRATINELYHLTSVDEVAVDEPIIKLFAQNKELIHILDLETDKQIDTPFSGYLCGLDDKKAVINVGEIEEDDFPLFTDDIFGVGLEGDYYYLTTHRINKVSSRYAIFPLDGINFDKSIQDYSEYNSVYYKSDKHDFWAITSVKQIGKI
jgi:hypothetical protein